MSLADAAEFLLDAYSGRYTGSWIVSSTQAMYLFFSSDYSVEMTGFAIKYVSAPSDVKGIVNKRLSGALLRKLKDTIMFGTLRRTLMV